MITIVLSCLSMALAVVFGVLIATGRVYGSRLVRVALTGYVELMRGTPILLQLFVLYYGIAAAIRLPAFVAALLGLALNYAAYESEIYRSALEAMSTGQLEAARTLGLNERQVLTLVRGPQAFRLALAPMTNDFVALLKDSSLVSVLTVLELTKQTQIFATNLGSWVIPGSDVRGAVSVDVAAALGPGAAARAALEGGHRMTDAVLRLSDVHLQRGARHILAGVVAAIPARGELVAVMGPSGSGKTTILRAIAGLEPFDAGRIVVEDVMLDGRPARRRARRCGGCGGKSAWCSSSIACSSICRRSTTCAWRRCTRTAWRPARRAAAGASAAGRVRRRAPRRRACRESCPAARPSAWPSPARWPSIRRMLLMDEPTASLDPATPRGAGRAAAAAARAGTHARRRHP